ncbi:MAG: T9SS type A sorting domain-containing protein [Sphingobacteriales bacterium]|nr:MAG: T9SS type A sorting domain-containing protein [Sphingobacteriales bacterium]
MVTDTLNPYPVNDTSAFSFGIRPWGRWGIIALQWKQKIDFDKKMDGGVVEFSIDSGATWQNTFNNPYVYNFYGYDTTNRDTLMTGEYAFSGTDSNWRDIWLCFDYSYLSTTDSLALRFRLLTDAVDSNKEGWLIDNMMAHVTYIHTAKAAEKVDKLTVYPTRTSGIVHIDAEKRNEFYIIEQLTITDAMGRRVKAYKNCPTRFWIDLSDQQDGLYYVRVKTNFQEKVFKIILAH